MTRPRKPIALTALALASVLATSIYVVWIGQGSCQPASAQPLIRTTFASPPKPPIALARSVALGTLAFSPQQIPGVIGKDYYADVPADYSYLRSRGVTSIRVPFLWERLQPSMYGGLDRRYLGYIRRSIRLAKQHHIGVVLDMHNFGKRYVNGSTHDVGTPQVPIDAVVDAWTRISHYFRDDTTVIAYEFMNEPGNLPRRVGFPAGPANNTLTLMNQAIITKLRNSGETHWFAIATEGYQAAQSFTYYYGKNPKRWWTDPMNRTMVAVHYYLDRGHVGAYIDPWTDSGHRSVTSDLSPVLQWGKKVSVPIYVSEIGVPERTVGQQNAGDVLRWMADFDTAVRLILKYDGHLSQWSAGARYLSPTTSEPLNSEGRVDYSLTSLQLSILMKRWGCSAPRASPRASFTARRPCRCGFSRR